MKFETLREAKKHLKKKTKYFNSDGLKIFRREGKRVKYKYVVCTYLQWLNEFY